MFGERRHVLAKLLRLRTAGVRGGRDLHLVIRLESGDGRGVGRFQALELLLPLETDLHLRLRHRRASRRLDVSLALLLSVSQTLLH